MRQLSLIKAPSLEFGGSLAKQGKRKQARPIDPKRALHVSFKAENAKESLLSATHVKEVEKIVRQAGERFQVKVYRYGNSGNHLHLLIKGRTRAGIQNFLRTAAALIARRVLQAKKGQPKGRYWSELVFSKVISWGREFRYAVDYVETNMLEGLGVCFTWQRQYVIRS